MAIPALTDWSRLRTQTNYRAPFLIHLKGRRSVSYNSAHSDLFKTVLINFCEVNTISKKTILTTHKGNHFLNQVLIFIDTTVLCREREQHGIGWQLLLTFNFDLDALTLKVGCDQLVIS